MRPSHPSLHIPPRSTAHRAALLVLLVGLLLGVLAAPSPLRSQAPARVIADLVTEPTNLGSEPVPLLDIGNEILVAADDGVHGLEPWLVNESGDARLLADLCAGGCSSLDPYDHQAGVAEDGRVFFLADDGQSNPDNFWRSHPTLWVSDLTTEGTRLASAETYFRVTELTAFGDGIAFAGNNFEGGGEELWTSDGTPEGTQRVADVNPVASSRPRGLVAQGNTLYFTASTSEQGREWWSWTEGGSANLVVDLCPGPCDGAFYDSALPRDFDVVQTGDRWLFVGYGDAADEALSLWGTDGTAAGTERLLQDFVVGLQASLPVFFEVEGQVVAPRDREVWSTDGTPAGTEKVGDLPTNFGLVSAVQPVGSGAQPAYLVDGAASLVVVRPGQPVETLAEGSFTEFRSLGDRVVFRDPTDFFSLATDTLDLRMIGSFELPGRSPRSPIRSLGPRVVFSAGDSAGQELWTSDGTEAGTRRLADLRPSRADSNPKELTRLGDRLLFTAETRTDADWPETPAELWATRGVGAERLLVGGSPKSLVPVGDLVFFQAYREDWGYEPWITDGTQEGTRSLGDLQPGTFSSYAREPAWLDGRLYFFADRGPLPEKGGQKLWVSDGTSQGTRIVLDIVPNFQACHPDFCTSPSGQVLPRNLRVVDDRLVFVAGFDASRDSQLWTSDGTAQGSSPIFGGDFEFEYPDPTNLYSDGDTFFFVAAEPSGEIFLWSLDRGFTQPPVRLAVFNYYQVPAIQGVDGWFAFARYFKALVSDGTTGGTRLVPTPYGLTYPRIAFDDQVFFSAADSQGEGGIGGELWATDGTAGGHRMVADIRPGPKTSGLRDFVTDGEFLYFTADDGETGHEVWRTDGATVERLTDLAPGPATASPSDLTLVGSQLYFTAVGEVGRELWAMPKSGQAGCARDATHHCLADGRFRVSTRWRVPATGEEGVGRVVDAEGAGTGDTGYFYFFGSDNVEFAVKVLDGRPLNDHRWVFTGALTDVEVWLDVYDTVTGLSRSWHRPPGDLCGFADVEAFPEPPNAPLDAAEFHPPRPAPAWSTTSVSSASQSKDGTCQADASTLCLHDRFEVRVKWHQDGQLFQARAVPFTEETGQFWFFGDENVEVILKILDARTLNGYWWVFHGVLTSLPLEIEVTDTVDGRTWAESTAGGELCGGADTSALPG